MKEKLAASLLVLCIFLAACGKPAKGKPAKGTVPVAGFEAPSAETEPEIPVDLKPEAPAEELPEELAVPLPTEASKYIPPEPAEESVREDVFGNLPELSDLYARAEEISSHYWVNVFIADRIPEDLEAEPFTDWDGIALCLDYVDGVLACYPEDFFRRFPYGQFDRIRIYLSGTGSSAGCYWSGETALSIQIDVNCALADKDFFNYTLHHELCHMIDARMQYAWGKEASLDEEIWNSYNPEGFSYAGPKDEDQIAVYDRFFEYFSFSYSTYSPLEDRATLFGAAMAYYQNPDYGCAAFDLPHCCEKYDYFCRCIRAEFSLEDNAEPLPWELVLEPFSPGRP